MAEYEDRENIETTEQEEKPSIPEELSFLDEDIARDAMKEWEELKAEEKVEEKPQEVEQPQPPQTSNETAELRNEVDNLRAQLLQMQQAVMQASQSPQKPPQPESPKAELTPEDIRMLKKSIDEEALKISGLTKDDIDSFDFADDDDERVERWKYAKELAKNRVLSVVQQAQMYKKQNRRQLEQLSEMNKRDYNEFVTRVTKDKEHPQVMAYAMGEYFNGLPPLQQFIVRSAYYNIEHQIADAKDAWIVKNYYEQVKSAYRNRGKKQSERTSQVKGSVQTPPNLPKSDLLSGTSTPADNAISNEELARLIENGELDKIPKAYQDYLNNSDVIFK